MKQLLVIALALASTNAFATRARVTAMANSPHLIDTQTVYSNPADMFYVGGDYVNMESGTTAGGAQNANAEGMIVKSMGDGKFGLSLGHQSENASIWGLRAAALIGYAAKSQQNPVELSYGMKNGDMAWAGTLIYSNYNDKLAAVAEKETTTGLRFGMRMGAMDVRAGLGLVNTYESLANGKYKGTLGISVGGGYMMDNLYLNGEIKMAGFKTENAAGTETHKVDQTSISLGALSSHKKDGNEFFYGAQLANVTRKDGATAVDSKTTTLQLPITMGLEVEANSWLALRASVKQSVLIHDSKTEAAGTTTAETAPGLNSTVAAVGAGLKFNKVTLDGTLEGLTGGTANQNLNGNTLLATVGATYMF